MRRAPFRTGDAVSIRGERWRIAGQSTFENVSIIDADGGDAANRGIRARFILPFEPVRPILARPPAPRVVTPARWRRAARTLLAGAVPHWTSLRAAARARLTILPYQLEPAMAITRGDACRVLVADEVGLGKTVQAGLIVAETIARTPDARVLVVSPAGLRDQWRSELGARFDLAAEVLDAEGVARNVAQLVPELNPWSIHPVVITSIDYVKRAEVMRSLEALTWDVVVFDEAHALAGRSDRATAAAALARRARVLVLLTATPHSGNDDSFTRLCALGDIEEGFPIRTFRRTRADVGLPHGRRSTRLFVRPTLDEAEMHQALEGYIARLSAESALDNSGSALLSAVLVRRACSSALSLVRSAERRSALLLGQLRAVNNQLVLPFFEADSDEEPGLELGVPGLGNTDEELGWLRRLTEAARAASASESKIRVLLRLVRRAAEPVIIFTEYRDTLRHLASALADCAPLELHGGLTQRERLEVLRQFTSGPATVLLATDAASEGLNLHQRCRLVINLELPWTPARLEQRIGRVDRLGQGRRVHAIHLVARATREEALAQRLGERASRIHSALDTPAPTNSDARRDAVREAARLVTARALFSADSPASGCAPLVAVFTRRQLPSRIWAFRFSYVDQGGQAVFETIAGVADARDDISLDHFVEQGAATCHARILATEGTAIAAWLDLASRREAAIINALRHSHARLSVTLLQPGLFDRRADRLAAAQASRVEAAVQQSAARMAAFNRARQLRMDERLPVFGAVFRA